jgi:hypothetical protein
MPWLRGNNPQGGYIRVILQSTTGTTDYADFTDFLIRKSAVEAKGSLRSLNPKTEIEPRITRIDTDYEEVVAMIFKPVWCIMKSVKSV